MSNFLHAAASLPPELTWALTIVALAVLNIAFNFQRLTLLVARVAIEHRPEARALGIGAVQGLCTPGVMGLLGYITTLLALGAGFLLVVQLGWLAAFGWLVVYWLSTLVDSPRIFRAFYLRWAQSAAENSYVWAKARLSAMAQEDPMATAGAEAMLLFVAELPQLIEGLAPNIMAARRL